MTLRRAKRKPVRVQNMRYLNRDGFPDGVTAGSLPMTNGRQT